MTESAKGLVRYSSDLQEDPQGDWIKIHDYAEAYKRIVAIESTLRDVALRCKVNQEPCKCWHCGVAVPAFKGSIIGPSCAKCHREKSRRPSDD